MHPLVIVSVDGLQPSLYLGDSSSCPFLAELALRGCRAEAALATYPSVTFSVHASIATGNHSARHGILANTCFDPERVKDWQGGESREWFFEAHRFRSTTLWDAAEAHGIRTALLRWPVTDGARVGWLMPEIFPPGEATSRERWETIRSRSTPELVEAVEAMDRDLDDPKPHRLLDQCALDAACWLLRRRAPGLMMVHFDQYDHETHAHGTRSAEALEALREVDRLLRSLVEDIDLRSTTLFVLGDHGFLDFEARIHVNSLLRSQGWIDTDGTRIRDWRAIAHTNCGQASVYVRDPALAGPTIELLRAHAHPGYRVLDRAALDRLHAFPGAICAVEAHAGYSMGQRLHGPLIERCGRIQGEHGYLPSHPCLQAGFLAVGAGVPACGKLGTIQLIDIAPTAAELLGIELGDCQGQRIEWSRPTVA